MKKNIALFLGSCIFILVALEVAIRILNIGPRAIDNIGYFRFVDNPKIIYELIPGSCVDSSLINQQGFKDSEFSKQKPPNLIRIVMLGDSITQGLYIPYGKTFSDKLEEILNNKALEKKNPVRYEVMNFGVGGYNLGAEVETLRTKAIQYDPDIVILNFFYNDTEPVPGLYVFFVGDKTLDERYKSYLFKRYIFNHSSFNNIIRSLLCKSRLYLFLTVRLNNLYNNLQNSSKELPNGLQKQGGREIIYNNLLEIHRLKKKYGFKFLICIHDDLVSRKITPNDTIIADVAKQFSFPHFHMLPYYKAKAEELNSLLAKEDSCHPNETAHRIIAEAIFTKLKKYNFINQNP